MWNIHPDKICQMFTNLADRHRGEMHSQYLDYQVMKYRHPHYEGLIEQLAPIVVIDYK